MPQLEITTFLNQYFWLFFFSFFFLTLIFFNETGTVLVPLTFYYFQNKRVNIFNLGLKKKLNIFKYAENYMFKHYYKHYFLINS